MRVTLEARTARFDSDGVSLDPSNEVVENLWVGRWDVYPTEAFADGFQVIVTLDGHARNAGNPPPGALLLSWPIEDSDEELPDQATLRTVVDLVERSVRAGRPTLVVCTGG